MRWARRRFSVGHPDGSLRFVIDVASPQLEPEGLLVSPLEKPGAKRLVDGQSRIDGFGDPRFRGRVDRCETAWHFDLVTLVSRVLRVSLVALVSLVL